MHARRLTLFAAASLLTAAAAESAPRTVFGRSPSGRDYSLTMGAAALPQTTVSLFCTGTAGDYGIVLISPEVPPRGERVEVRLSAAGAASRALRFERLDESLSYLASGGGGAALIERLAAAASFVLAWQGQRATFSPAAEPKAAADFRAACGFPVRPRP